MSDVKPGIKSTEFYLTTVVGALVALREASGELSTEELVAATVIAVAYIISRGYTKGKAAEPAPLIVEKDNE